MLRSRPCLAEPPGRVALDDEDLRQRRILDRAVGELAGQQGVLQRGLAAGEVARLARRLAGPGRRYRLVDDLVGLLRVLLEEVAQLLVDDGADEALDPGVAELRLGLALELRVAQLDRDHRREALADVLAGEVRVLALLEQALLLRVAVDRAGQGGAEAAEVRAALVRVDVVGEGEDGLLVGGVPLHRHLDGPLLGLALDEDDLLVDGVLVLVEVDDEVADAAVVLELGALALAPLVDQDDPHATREEGRLAQALLEHVPFEVERLEDLGVGAEGDRRAGLLRRRALLQRALGRPALVVLRPDVAVALDVDVQRLRQRVDHGHPDPVQAAGDLVAPAVPELPAGVQHGEDDLDGGLLLLGHDGDRDAAPVVDHRDRAVGMDRHLDGVAVAGQGLVHRVVYDLVDEVMQAPRAGRPDVHPGALADSLEPFEDGDVLGVVSPALALPVSARLGLLLCHDPPA